MFFSVTSPPVPYGPSVGPEESRERVREVPDVGRVPPGPWYDVSGPWKPNQGFIYLGLRVLCLYGISLKGPDGSMFRRGLKSLLCRKVLSRGHGRGMGEKGDRPVYTTSRPFLGRTDLGSLFPSPPHCPPSGVEHTTYFKSNLGLDMCPVSTSLRDSIPGPLLFRQFSREPPPRPYPSRTETHVSLFGLP